MLWIALVDRIGSGLWASVSVLYFTYVTGLSVAEVGTLVAVSGAIGIAAGLDLGLDLARDLVLVVLEELLGLVDELLALV
ncbi:hypothetical protein ABZS63_12095, partial [Streptomyces sp. NPDC005568]